MSAKELLQNWQESLKHALAEKLGAEHVEEEQLLEAVGLQVETGMMVGMFYSADCFSYDCE